jgi:hypothetical protein
MAAPTKPGVCRRRRPKVKPESSNAGSGVEKSRPGTAQGSTARGTGEPKAHGTAEAIERGRQIAVSMMDRAEAKYRHEHGIPHLREDCESCAEEYWNNRLRPVHYREAAESLRKIADADEKADPPIGGEVDYLRGWRHAANRIESVAKDLEDGDER